MKVMLKKFAMVILVVLFFLAVGVLAAHAGGMSESQQTYRNVKQVQQEQIQFENQAMQSVPVPNVSYFQERRTVSKWFERFDKPNVVTYVYLISYGNFIGYYVADGKPASTRSYLTPEDRVLDWYTNDPVISAPDIDGTWGTNNPGIRFFTAEGTAVEWGGDGASYLYSDAPLPIKVPKLNIVLKQ